jgi:hypothetical protein
MLTPVVAGSTPVAHLTEPQVTGLEQVACSPREPDRGPRPTGEQAVTPLELDIGAEALQPPIA